MNKKDFEELLKSVKEFGLMEKGEINPSREFIVERDLLNLRDAQKEEANAPTVSLEEVEIEFGV